MDMRPTNRRFSSGKFGGSVLNSNPDGKSFSSKNVSQNPARN